MDRKIIQSHPRLSTLVTVTLVILFLNEIAKELTKDIKLPSEAL